MCILTSTCGRIYKDATPSSGACSAAVSSIPRAGFYEHPHKCFAVLASMHRIEAFRMVSRSNPSTDCNRFENGCHPITPLATGRLIPPRSLITARIARRLSLVRRPTTTRFRYTRGFLFSNNFHCLITIASLSRVAVVRCTLPFRIRFISRTVIPIFSASHVAGISFRGSA